MQLYHSDMVAAVLRQRLLPEGKAYIALAVRRQVRIFTHSACLQGTLMHVRSGQQDLKLQPNVMVNLHFLHIAGSFGQAGRES